MERTGGEEPPPNSRTGARPSWLPLWPRPPNSSNSSNSSIPCSSDSPITSGRPSSSTSSSSGPTGSGEARRDSSGGAGTPSSSGMAEGAGLPAVHPWQRSLQKQMEGWRNDPQWADVPPRIEVTVPAESFIHLDCSSVLGLPPDAVFDTLCDPANARVFKNVKGVLRRRVLEDDGTRQVVELEQAAVWRFLFLSGTFSVHLRVVQDRASYTLAFNLLKPGFMKQFRGFWKLVPVPVPPSSAMPPASPDSHHHLLQHHYEHHPHHQQQRHQVHPQQHLYQGPAHPLDAPSQQGLPLHLHHGYQTPPAWHSQKETQGGSTQERLTSSGAATSSSTSNGTTSSSSSDTSSSSRWSSGDSTAFSASSSTPLPGSTVAPQPWGLVHPRPLVLQRSGAADLDTSAPKDSQLALKVGQLAPEDGQLVAETPSAGPTVPWYGPQTRVATYARLVQEVSPALVPPPWLAHYLRGISANTTWEVLRDLQVEALRLRYGLGEGCDMRREMRRILAGEGEGAETGVGGARGKERGRDGEKGWRREGRRAQRRGRVERDARHGRRGVGPRRVHEAQHTQDGKA